MPRYSRFLNIPDLNAEWADWAPSCPRQWRNMGRLEDFGRAPVSSERRIAFRPAPMWNPARTKFYVMALKRCAVEDAILQRVRIPPGK